MRQVKEIIVQKRREIAAVGLSIGALVAANMPVESAHAIVQGVNIITSCPNDNPSGQFEIFIENKQSQAIAGDVKVSDPQNQPLKDDRFNLAANSNNFRDPLKYGQNVNGDHFVIDVDNQGEADNFTANCAQNGTTTTTEAPTTTSTSTSTTTSTTTPATTTSTTMAPTTSTTQSPTTTSTTLAPTTTTLESHINGTVNPAQTELPVGGVIAIVRPSLSPFIEHVPIVGVESNVVGRVEALQTLPTSPVAIPIIANPNYTG